VDFLNPSNSSFSGPVLIATAPFTFTNTCCVPQADTAIGLEVNPGILLNRLAYRNLGGTEILVTNHTVDNGQGQNTFRWYEIHNPNSSAPIIYQQGTYAPDAVYRWMGSTAMDKFSDIAVGYSVSTSTMHPSIRFTGRTISDPLDTLSGEASIL